MPSSISSDSEDEKRAKTSTKSGVHVEKDPKKKKRIKCPRLIRNKWFIIGTSAAILLIIVAIVLGVTLRPQSRENNLLETIPLQWWQNSTIYRVYVTSFADSDGDGKGDLKGIQARLNYLSELGINLIWLSSLQDTNTVSGQDVIDSKALKDEYGLIEDLRDLINAAKNIGMRVIFDFVLNHSGTAHKWFKQSQMKTEPYVDYHVWAKSKGTDTNGNPIPPNNWLSVYGGSAWTWSENRQEYFLHQFWKNEPDLNYRNPQIVEEMNKAASFWLDLGVDGFFLRDSPYLIEDNEFRNELQISDSNDYMSLSHNYTRDLIESYQVVSNIFFNLIKTRNDQQEKILLMDATERIMSDDQFSQMYQIMSTNVLYSLNPIFDGPQLKAAVQQAIENFNRTQVWPVWTLGNEDESRILSKFGQLSFGLQVSSIFLPGSSSIYYGEETQMTNHPSIRFEDTIDGVARDAGPQNYTLVSRDPFRCPMRWNSSLNSGFTSAPTPWLPINSNDPTVDFQKSKTNSMWFTIKELNELKKSSLSLTNGTFEFVDFAQPESDLFSFVRTHINDQKSFLIIWNIGNQRKIVSLDNATCNLKPCKFPFNLLVVRKIRPDGSQKEPLIVKINDISVEAKEIIVFSYSRY